MKIQLEAAACPDPAARKVQQGLTALLLLRKVHLNSEHWNGGKMQLSKIDCVVTVFLPGKGTWFQETRRSRIFQLPSRCRIHRWSTGRITGISPTSPGRMGQR
jgi:hypothetical protein